MCPVEPGDGVSFVVPHQVSLSGIEAGGEATLFFRVRRPLEKPTFYLEGMKDGAFEQVKRKKARVAVPGEMEQVKVDMAQLAGYSALRVRVEGGE